MKWNSLPEEEREMYNEKAASANQDRERFFNVDDEVSRLLTRLRQIVSDMM